MLLIIDNSANWSLPLGGSTRFAAIKGALASVVNALSDATGNVNIGLMLYNEAGGIRLPGGAPTGPNDGAYVRYALRSMSSATNRSALVTLLNGLDATLDRGNAQQPALALEEARRYIGGLALLNGGNTSAKLDRQAIAASGPAAYAPPLAASCQRTIVVVISNGPAAADDQTLAVPFVRALNGGSTPAMLPLPAPYPAPLLPATQSAATNWMDEYAALLRRAPYGAPAPSGSMDPSGILTYGIAVHDPASSADNTNASASGRALVLNASIQGGGKYFDAVDAAALAQSFGAILSEVQAANSIFSSATLPFSATTPGTYLNQVYLGMVRP
ncbi:MAG: VWA domain-containing protein, partial [Betaproteobacteria bacterium]